MSQMIQEVIADTYLDMCLNDLLDKQPYKILIRKNFDTACWSYKKGTHHIFIGDKILANLKDEHDSDMNCYIASYLYHEISHSNNTSRDIALVNKILKDYKIPFSLWNLAEDARIEHLMRINSDRDFKWTAYEDSEVPFSPVDTLFFIIHRDGCTDGLDEIDDSQKVVNYYNMFCEAKDSIEVIEILVDWLDDFSNTEKELNELQDKLEKNQDSNSGKSEEGSQDSNENSEKSEKSSHNSGEKQNSLTVRALEDLKHTMALEDESSFDKAMSESFYIKGESQSDKFMFINKDVELNSTSIEEHTSAKVSNSNSVEWDLEKAKSLTDGFLSIFKDKSGYKKSRRPARRINKKAFRLGSVTDKYYIKQSREVNSIKTVTIVLDCSGSMGRPMKDMRIVIGVFNELVKARKIKANVILSGANRGLAIHETFILPLEDEVIGSFAGKHGSEGIQSSMKSNVKLLKESDFVFVLTDGRISDEPIDREFYHLMGIYTIGIYIGNSERCNLNKWFDKGISVQSVEHCADQLISHLKRKV